VSTNEGFARLAYAYNRRLWIVVIVPVCIFVWRYLSGPTPPNFDPETWGWLRAIFLTVLTISGLRLIVWIAAGFLAPSPKPQQKRQSDRR